VDQSGSGEGAIVLDTRGATPDRSGGRRANAETFLRFLAFIVSFLIALVPLVTAAQTPGEVPFQVTIDQNAIMRQYAPPLTRPKSLGGTMGAPIAGIPAEQLGETSFRLASVDVEGAITLNPSLFTPLWRGLIGKQITLLDIKAVLEGIEDIYRQNDYRAAAIVPRQDFATGRITVVVYEFYIKELLIKGDTKRLRGRLDPFFERITEMRPMRALLVYRYLLLAEDQAGISIYGEVVRIDNEPGAIRIELTITFKPGNLTLGLDNYGPKDAGPLQAQANARVNDIFGLFESTDVLVVTNPAAPDQLAFVNWAQLFPMGTTGFSFNYFVGQSWSAPGGLSRLVQLNSKVLNFGVSLNYALLRSQERNVILNAGVFGNDSSVDILQQAVTRDRARWVAIGAKYDDELFGVKFILNPGYLKGVDAFGSNLPDYTYNFAALTLNGVLTANLTDTLSAKVLFNGQLALTTLPAAVIATYGGLGFGQAFDPGAIAGNSAVLVSGELAHAIPTGLSWLQDLSLFVYGDYGAVWNPPGVAYPYASLASLGFGVRVGIGERLIATGLVAQPLWYDAELAAFGIEQQTRYRFTIGLRF
jgi:hemolysin activation/secretion protein